MSHRFGVVGDPIVVAVALLLHRVVLAAVAFVVRDVVDTVEPGDSRFDLQMVGPIVRVEVEGRLRFVVAANHQDLAVDAVDPDTVVDGIVIDYWVAIRHHRHFHTFVVVAVAEEVHKRRDIVVAIAEVVVPW